MSGITPSASRELNETLSQGLIQPFRVSFNSSATAMGCPTESVVLPISLWREAMFAPHAMLAGGV